MYRPVQYYIFQIVYFISFQVNGARVFNIFMMKQGYMIFIVQTNQQYFAGKHALWFGNILYNK
jgi:hypothetical protein